jgi:hypothetical protein
MFVLYALLAGLAALAYQGLPRSPGVEERSRSAPLTTAKRNVYVLAALFSLDAFAGGFVVQSMLALWLYQEYDLSLAAAGSLFFWMGLLTAISYLVAVRIANRFGLINTMVFTHLPSSLCLIAIPFMPALSYVIVLLFVRSADGRSNTQFLRDGHRAPGRATGRRQHYDRATKPCLRSEPPPRRFPSRCVVVRVAAVDRWRTQDRL